MRIESIVVTWGVYFWIIFVVPVKLSCLQAWQNSSTNDWRSYGTVVLNRMQIESVRGPSLMRCGLATKCVLQIRWLISSDRTIKSNTGTHTVDRSLFGSVHSLPCQVDVFLFCCIHSIQGERFLHCCYSDVHTGWTDSCSYIRIQGGPGKVRPTYIFDGNIKMHSWKRVVIHKKILL